jgi:lipoprotein NlpD
MIYRARSCFALFWVALAVAAVLAGCMTRAPAPVIERVPFPYTGQSPPPAPEEGLPGREPVPPVPPTYAVKRGDTLYQIALDHGLDYRELAAWNNIENVNVIRVGQVLLLGPPEGQGGAATAPLVTTAPVTPSGGEVRPPAAPTSGRPNTPTFKTEPRAVKVPFSEHALAQLQQQSPAPAAIAPEARATAPAAPAASATTPALPPKTESGRVPEIDDDNLGWIWPATGKIVAGFSESANL